MLTTNSPSLVASPLAEKLENIGSDFIQSLGGIRLREQDYTYWLYTELAHSFGRERVLGRLGVETSTLREWLHDSAPLLGLFNTVLAGGQDHYPDILLFSRSIVGTGQTSIHWARLDRAAPTIDAMIELKVPVHKNWRKRASYQRDIAKLAVLGAFVRRYLRDQPPPYLGAWILDVASRDAEARARRLCGFDGLVGPQDAATAPVRVVLFRPDGTRTLLRGDEANASPQTTPR